MREESECTGMNLLGEIIGGLVIVLFIILIVVAVITGINLLGVIICGIIGVIAIIFSLRILFKVMHS